MSALKIGTRVRATHRIKRGGENSRREWKRGWLPVEGYVVGTRILSNGTVETHTDYDGFSGKTYTWSEYKRDPGSAIRAVLIAPNIRAKHVLAFVEDVEVIE